MKFKITALVLTLGLISGCSAIPSFYDDNESYIAAKIRLAVDEIDCNLSYKPQYEFLRSEVRFLELYSESKGSNDLYEMIQPMQETIDGVLTKPNNKIYCQMKKKFLTEQSATITNALMERF